MKRKAFVLFSGGLDSLVTVKVLQEQGIEVIAIHFKSIMYVSPRKKKGHSIEEWAERLGVKLICLPKSMTFFDMIEHPKHGYGSAINPCMDCRIYYLQTVRHMMEEYGVSFVATGEVLGQRPKSQRRDCLRIIERESGIEGLVLRPLCAQSMAETIPEKEGWVDRSKLLGITGRGRTEQITIIESYGMHDFPNPAGGCQLAEQCYVPKVKDMFAHGYDELDIRLLSCGRHFRIDGTKVIVSKDEYEGAFMLEKASEGLIVEPDDFAGPIGFIRGDVTDAALSLAASAMLFHSKSKGVEGETVITAYGKKTSALIMSEESLLPYRIV